MHPHRPAPAIARWIATWFGCGLSPKAPGTVGSLGTVPLHYALCSAGPVAYIVATAALTLLGTWAAQRYAESAGDKDPQAVVIDEVVGTLLAMGLAHSAGLPAEILGFVLFRVFDITKPGLIDRVQYLKPAGVGIMADDVLAGLLAGACARLAGLYLLPQFLLPP